MALIKCEECGREVSDKAASCPGCGAPIPGLSDIGPTHKPGNEKKSKIGCLTFSIIGVVLLVIVVGISNHSPSRSPSISTSTAAADARAVCNALDSMDVEVICKTYPSAKRIDLIINADTGEAVKMCSGIRDQIKPYTRQLDMWKLTLYSPTDIATPTASCFL